MAKRFVALPLAAVMGTTYDSAEVAAAQVGRKVDIEGTPHVIVEVHSQVRRRNAPNVEVVPFTGQEVANG